MRSKEDAHDYRYFPDPDLLALEISSDDIEKIRATLPELPEKKCLRYMTEFELSAYDAKNLVASLPLALYFEEVIHHTHGSHAKLAANWIMGDLSAALNKYNLEIYQSPVNPKKNGGIIATHSRQDYLWKTR